MVGVLFPLAVLLAANGPGPHTGSYPFRTSISVEAERMTLADSFARHGRTFTAPALGVSATVRTDRWYVETTAQMLRQSLRQRRMVVSVRRHVRTIGRFAVAVQGDYWELGFRNSTARLEEMDVQTHRQARMSLLGIAVVMSGPLHSEVSFSQSGGWYGNRYDGVLRTDAGMRSEQLSLDDVGVSATTLGIRDITIRDRIWISCSARYFRLVGGTSRWVPRSELSGETTVNVRVARIRNKNLLIGARVRLGPSGPGIVSNRSLGLRGILRMR